MAGKAKFDKDAAFRAIIGRDEYPTEGPKAKDTARVQRAYWLDKDLDKALKRKSLEEEKTLTEAVNEALRAALTKYLEN